MFGIEGLILGAVSGVALGKAEAEAGIKSAPLPVDEDDNEGITAGDILMGAIIIDAIDGDHS